jgi:malonyl-CoA/methylmalonyl-CoA synthetase
MHSHSLKHAFENSFQSLNAKTAITFFRHGDGESVLTYGQLNQDSNQLAHAFREEGVARGDRVIFYTDKSLFSVVAHIALQKLGAVTVQLNPGLRKAEMEYLVRDADPVLILTESGKEAMIAAIDSELKTINVSSKQPYQYIDFFRSFPKAPLEVEVQSDDPALIIYTSGTTGNPKGAVMTQQNLIHDAYNIVDIWEITERDVLCHALPLFHIHGLCFALHTALLSGAHILMLDNFHPAIVLKFLSGTRIAHLPTLFMAVPTMYAKVMDYLESLDDNHSEFSHLRLLTSGSAPLLVKEFKRIENIFGQAPVEREGMSETGMNFSNPVNGERKPGSIGLPLPGLNVRIVDPASNQDVQSGQTGEIWLNGPGITAGYWRKPEETQEAFVNEWFRTGDLGRVDDAGYYYLTDRIKHIIISGGENISAKEVETVINSLEEVVESAVVGVPDEKWGEKVVAAITTKPGVELTIEQVQTRCSKKLHKWKCPKDIVFVNNFPKNAMGKILKEEVKNLFCEAS